MQAGSLGQEFPGLASVPRFGSVVTEYERPNSGLDPAMYTERPLPPTKLCKLLKRGIKGTYVSVEPYHLFRYLDEQALRFNEREGEDADRFSKALGLVSGRRLTYDELTGKAETLEA